MARVPRTRPVVAKAEDHARLEDFWDEPTPPPSAARGDLDRLQGAWVCIAGRRPAEFLISGNHVTVHFADGTIYMGAVAVSGNGRVAAMDIRIEEGPPRHRGQMALCIYELDGDLLRWCTTTPGVGQRPGKFDENDPQLLCLLLRRKPRDSRH